MNCPNCKVGMEIQYACEGCGMRAGYVGQPEEAVIEAAICLITLNKPVTPAHAYKHAYDDLKTSVDALIKARES